MRVHSLIYYGISIFAVSFFESSFMYSCTSFTSYTIAYYIWCFRVHVANYNTYLQIGSQLTVTPMMDISGEREEGWTLFL